MRINVSLTSKHNAYDARGVFTDGNLIVFAGGYIQLDFASHIRGGKLALSFRNNPQVVDKEGRILCDCSFNSPSTAAQFVTGRSCNGYAVWRVEPKKTLGAYLKEQGIR